MISRYVKHIEIEDGVFAVFHSLLCKPLYVDGDELQRILNDEIESFNEEEQTALYERGIFLRDATLDARAYELLVDAHNKRLNVAPVLYLIPTSGCNLACRYCIIGKMDSPATRSTMSWEVAKTAIDKTQKHIATRRLKKGELVFYGAEPLLAWNLIRQATSYVRANGWAFDVSLVTNATLLTEEIALEAKKLDITIGVSLDGPQKITDASRLYKTGDQSVYEDAMRAVDLLRKHDVSFSFSVTLSDALLNAEEEFLRWALEQQIAINFNLVHYAEKDAPWQDYYPKASKFLLRAYDKLQRGGIVESRVERRIESFRDRSFCFADCAAVGGSQFVVCPNGDVCVCQAYWNQNRNRCGNILTDEFVDFFQTDEYRLWRDNLTINKPECLNCEAIYICGGGCPYMAEALFGDRREIDRCFCIHVKTTLKWLLQKHYRA